MTTAVEQVDSSPVRKSEIFGWCMYYVADSAFTTVIVTALYAPYFSKIVVRTPSRQTSFGNCRIGL